MDAWYLIQTKARQEALAKENLQRQEYNIYLPIASTRHRRRGKSYYLPGPMFPLYLFIYLNDGIDDWGPIRSTIGVSKLVYFGRTPARVPSGLIETLRAREDADGLQIMPDKNFNIGDKVLISHGIFEGYEAIIHAKSDQKRSLLLLGLIESFIKIELESHSLVHLKG
ncbi:MAG: transcriptional antiterminator RfaH [Gammaproteobacteria bacterium]